MYIILFIIALIVLDGYCIYKLSDGKILKSIFYPIKSGREAAEEYLEIVRRRKK